MYATDLGRDIPRLKWHDPSIAARFETAYHLHKSSVPKFPTKFWWDSDQGSKTAKVKHWYYNALTSSWSYWLCEMLQHYTWNKNHPSQFHVLYKRKESKQSSRTWYYLKAFNLPFKMHNWPTLLDEIQPHTIIDWPPPWRLDNISLIILLSDQ